MMRKRYTFTINIFFAFPKQILAFLSRFPWDPNKCLVIDHDHNYIDFTVNQGPTLRDLSGITCRRAILIFLIV